MRSCAQGSKGIRLPRPPNAAGLAASSSRSAGGGPEQQWATRTSTRLNVSVARIAPQVAVKLGLLGRAEGLFRMALPEFPEAQAELTLVKQLQLEVHAPPIPARAARRPASSLTLCRTPSVGYRQCSASELRQQVGAAN